MSKKKTKEEFINEMKVVNPNIMIMGEYINARTNIKCKCLLDGCEWNAMPTNLLKGSKCPVCNSLYMSKTQSKTYECFIQELKEINPNIQILDKYINSKTKVYCKCLIDGYEWYATPDNLLRSKCCPKCSKSIRKTTETFVDEVKNINPNIEIIGEHINSKTKIKCRCIVDNYEWEATPSNLLKGRGCPECKRLKIGKSNIKTTQQFIDELQKVNPNITIIDEYVNSSSKISYRCNICGYIHKATPSHLLRGNGCPKCEIKKISLLKSKSHKEFMSEIKECNHKVEIIGKYINQNTKIKCKCLECGKEWLAYPSNLLKGQGCSDCYGTHLKTTKDFISEMKHINPYIEIVGEHVNNATKIKCKCLKCCKEFESTPAHLISDYGCPYCHISKGERAILKYLDNKNFNYIFQHRFDKCKNERPLPFDFYLPDYNMCIEYDGEQHYRPIEFKGVSKEQSVINYEFQKQKDEIKNKYCQDNKIKLIRIPYWEFDNIENILNKLFSPTTTE